MPPIKAEPEYKSNLLTVTANAVVVITCYTVACRLFGYRMVKPSHVEKGVFFVRTIGGKILKANFG